MDGFCLTFATPAEPSVALFSGDPYYLDSNYRSVPADPIVDCYKTPGEFRAGG